MKDWTLLDKTMNDPLNNRELVSALADGQLRGRDFSRAVELAASDADAQAAWHDYHLVGDVLRSPQLACRMSDEAFLARLRPALAAEPLFNRPVATTPVADDIPPVVVAAQQGVAANDPGIRWKLVAGFASLAAVAAIGWNAAGGLDRTDAQPQLARAPAAAPAPATAAAVSVAAPDSQAGQGVSVAGTQQVMIRDPRLDELLSAHRQFGGTSALQMPAGFLRNATFEGPARQDANR